jgi:hypothetical protein
MFSDPLVLDNDNSPTNDTRTFNKVGYPTLGAVDYIVDPDIEHGVLQNLKISHQKVGSGANTRYRHLVRFEVPSYDAVLGLYGTHAPVVAYAVFDIPTNYVPSGAEIQLARILVGFLRGCDADDEAPDYDKNFTPFLQGQT